MAKNLFIALRKEGMALKFRAFVTDAELKQGIHMCFQGYMLLSTSVAYTFRGDRDGKEERFV